jgi:hypothetical protein
MEPWVLQWLALYRHYAAGHLYQSGGISDQPAIYLAVMRLIESVVNAKES